MLYIVGRKNVRSLNTDCVIVCGICCVAQQRLDTAHFIYSSLGHNNSIVISGFIFSTFSGGKGSYPELGSLLTVIWISHEICLQRCPREDWVWHSVLKVGLDTVWTR